MPEISILLSVFGSRKEVSRAIMSMLDQSYQDFELIVIDDGSTKEENQLLSEIAHCDSRIKLIRNATNMGLAFSLNAGIKAATGRYIARMDADDYSLPDRLQFQYDYLNNNPHVDVIGSAANILNKSGLVHKKCVMPRSHAECVAYLPKSTPFIHPSVMIRKTFFDKNGFYNEHLRKAQDYELWARGAANSCYENLPDVLLEYTLPESKSIKTIWQEMKVRTQCAWRYNYLFKSLFYSLYMVLYYLVLNLRKHIRS